MAVTESKLKSGTFTIGAASPGPQLIVATQAANVRIIPNTSEDGDPLELLSGDVLAADATTEWQLAAGLIQDFTDPAGVIAYSWDHAGETVPFVWAPAGALGPSYAGNVVVRPLEVGGDVNKRLENELEWVITAQPTVTYPTP